MKKKQKLVVINPNTSTMMTDRIRLVADSVVGADFELIVTNPPSGPVSIEGYYDEAMSLAGLLGIVKHHDDADGFVIACFDDTGLDAARTITTSPVVGIGEAAFHMASMISNKFGVVTTLARSVPALEHNLVRYGLSARCSGVVASDVPVLEVEAQNGKAYKRIAAEVENAIKNDRAEAVVLGCAGMAELALALQRDYGVPVLEGISCAIKLVEAMLYLKLENSKVCGYAQPRLK